MKFLLSFLVLLSAGGIYFYKNPAQFYAAEDYLSRKYQSTFFEKRVVVSGLRSVRRETIDKALPVRRSIPWWIMNETAIEGEILKNSFVQSASIGPCSGNFLTSWGCFVVQVTEREPAYIASVGSKMWMLGSDGGYIASSDVQDLEGLLLRSLNPDVPKPKIINGLSPDGSSADLVKSRFHYVHQAIGVIEGGVGRSVRRLDLKDNGELVVKLDGLPFGVTFDAYGDAISRLEDEVVRLKKLLADFRGREDEVEGVDLAFDKIAVVRFVGGSSSKVEENPKKLLPKSQKSFPQGSTKLSPHH